MTYFLSHGSVDKPIVRSFGVELQVVGGEVFFDEWNIRAGESIPQAIEGAVRDYEVFLLFWSSSAAESMWTKREYFAAVKTFIEDPSRRLIVLRLDDEPVPALVADLKWVDLRSTDVSSAVSEVMGFRGPAERIRAIQNFLEERSIEVEYLPGYGAIVGCPRCGAGLDKIEGYSETDYVRDDQYAGARCTACGWNDGGEI